MKKGILALLIAVLSFSTSEVLFSASREQEIVMRVDTGTVVLKHRTLVIQALGMGKAPTMLGRGGWLVRRGAQAALNKDGLLEYNLMFKGVPNYSGFKLQPIKANLHERSVPGGVKGVRMFGKFNEVDALLPEPKQPKSKSFLPFGKKRHEENEAPEQQ